MKNFLSVKDTGNVDALVRSAVNFRKEPLSKKDLGSGKRLGLIFLNPSMRTRLSTQLAAQNLGMEAIVFNASQDGWSLEFEEGAIMNGTSVEHVKDAAPILGRYFDILGVRTFPSLKNKEEDYAEFVMNQFVKYSGIPIVSLESATVHPLQSLTDIITIIDHLPLKNKKRPKVVLTWAPHVKPLPQCVANSFCEWINAWDGCDFTITHPEGYELDQRFTNGATITNDQAQALTDADFVYVKNWSSYNDYGKITGNQNDWMLTNEKLVLTNDAKVMHCLPVRRNIELSDEVLDSANSIVTEQAANRVWAAQAVLAEILNEL
ncbi:MAG: N-acetylornithine carbamoyltransferase [Bacteroidota bacterium]|nr:N-acetylornithine carbamoyltransferase [Bacteroidota bacterium]